MQRSRFFGTPRVSLADEASTNGMATERIAGFTPRRGCSLAVLLAIPLAVVVAAFTFQTRR